MSDLVLFMSSSEPHLPLLKQRPSGVYFPLVWRMSKACVSWSGSNVSSHVFLIIRIGSVNCHPWIHPYFRSYKFSYTNEHIVTFDDEYDLFRSISSKSALVLMPYWREQTKLCIICFTNPILNAFNWLCALASQLYWLVSFRDICIAFTCLYSSLSYNKQKGGAFPIYVFAPCRWVLTCSVEIVISPQLFLVHIVSDVGRLAQETSSVFVALSLPSRPRS